MRRECKNKVAAALHGCLQGVFAEIVFSRAFFGSAHLCRGWGWQRAELGGGLLCDLGVTAAFCLFLCLCAQRWVGETSIFFPKGGLEIVLCHQADSKSLQVYCEAGFSVPLSLFSRWEMAQAMGFRVYFCLFLLCFGRTTSISLGMRWFRCSEMAEDGQGFSSCLFWDWE